MPADVENVDSKDETSDSSSDDALIDDGNGEVEETRDGKEDNDATEVEERRDEGEDNDAIEADKLKRRKERIMELLIKAQELRQKRQERIMEREGDAMATASASSTGAPVEPHDHLQKLRRMKTALEKVECDMATKDADELAHAAYEAAARCREAGDISGLVAAWSEALDHRPGDVTALASRALARTQMEDPEGAIADLSEALRLHPDRADLLFHRATIRSDQGNDEGAMSDFDESLRLDPGRAEVWCCRGTARMVRGDAAGAIQDCSEALKADEGYAGAWGLRGVAKHHLGDIKGAAEDCARALALDPDLAWVQPALEDARAAMGESGREVSRCNVAVPIVDTAGPCAGATLSAPMVTPAASTEMPLRACGNDHFRKGNLREALVAYQEAYTSNEPGFVLALSNQALCHHKLGEYHEAVVAADLCLKHDGAPYKALFTKSKALAAQHDWPAAREALRELRNLPGLPPEAYAVAEREEQEQRLVERRSAELPADS